MCACVYSSFEKVIRHNNAHGRLVGSSYAHAAGSWISHFIWLWKQIIKYIFTVIFPQHCNLFWLTLIIWFSLNNEDSSSQNWWWMYSRVSHNIASHIKRPELTEPATANDLFISMRKVVRWKDCLTAVCNFPEKMTWQVRIRYTPPGVSINNHPPARQSGT